MASIEQYKQTNGYYDTAKIREDAGMNSRSALFADIFGGDDSDGGQPTAKLAPAWQALLDEAERRNNEIDAAAKMESEDEARALVQQPEPWSRETWKRLVELQYATRHVEDGGEQGYMSASYTLTERGERLLDLNYRAPGAYDDQVGIDG